MHFAKLKELVRKLGGVLVLDGDEPKFVILSYDKYESMDSGEEVSLSTRHNGLVQPNGMVAKRISDEMDQEAVEKLNQEILGLKEEIRQKEEAELFADEQSTEPVAGAIDLD